MKTFFMAPGAYTGGLSRVGERMPTLGRPLLALGNGLSSSLLAEVLGEIAQGYVSTTTENLEGAWAVVERAVPEWSEVFSHKTTSGFLSVIARIEALGEGAQDVSHDVGRALSELLMTLEFAVSEMAAHERAATAAAVELSLRDLGYSVAQVELMGIAACRGRRADGTIAVLVAPGGGVSIRHVSTTDEGPPDQVNLDLIERVSANGVSLEEVGLHNFDIWGASVAVATLSTLKVLRTGAGREPR